VLELKDGALGRFKGLDRKMFKILTENKPENRNLTVKMVCPSRTRIVTLFLLAYAPKSAEKAAEKNTEKDQKWPDGQSDAAVREAEDAEEVPRDHF
jgi:hypothetical protein